MTKGSNRPLPTDEIPIEDEELATHQEAVPVPFLCGTRKVAVRWLGPAESMITQQSDDPVVGKK